MFKAVQRVGLTHKKICVSQGVCMCFLLFFKYTKSHYFAM